MATRTLFLLEYLLCRPFLSSIPCYYCIFLHTRKIRSISFVDHSLVALVDQQPVGRIKRGNSTEAQIPQSPQSERAGSDVEDEAGIRITVDETLEKGSISGETYMTYIRAMGGLLVALIIVLLIGLSLIVTAASNWWLSVMLSRDSEVINDQLNGTFDDKSDSNFTSSLPMNATAGNMTTTPSSVVVSTYHNDLVIYGSMLAAIILACILRAWAYVKVSTFYLHILISAL